MSYLRKINYKIIPSHSYQIVRNCSGCGCKSMYQNTYNFRVNANGNKVDVWLIYQCEKCKHTFNLSIYERKNPNSIPPEEYKMFLENNRELAEVYGMDKTFFMRNRADVDEKEMEYCLRKEDTELPDVEPQGEVFVIHNPDGIKVREEKIAAELLQLTRSEVKKKLKEGMILIEKDKFQRSFTIHME